MTISSISTTKSQLGSTIRQAPSAQYIVPATYDRPFILGSGVFEVNPTPILKPTKAKVGGIAANKNILKGIIALGLGQVMHRDTFVDTGFAGSWNNLALAGGYWAALDLQYFDISKVDGAKLTADANGVFSFTREAVNSTGASTNPTANVEVLDAKVHNFEVKQLYPPLNKTISVAGVDYVFNYPKGLGGLALFI